DAPLRALERPPRPPAAAPGPIGRLPRCRASDRQPLFERAARRSEPGGLLERRAGDRLCAAETRERPGPSEQTLRPPCRHPVELGQSDGPSLRIAPEAARSP